MGIARINILRMLLQYKVAYYCEAVTFQLQKYFYRALELI